jgi:hypothetical protein
LLLFGGPQTKGGNIVIIAEPTGDQGDIIETPQDAAEESGPDNFFSNPEM